MDLSEFGSSWIWHPSWKDFQSDAAGRFVHFKKIIQISNVPLHPVIVNITADTRYKLYINSRFVSHGPVKGDENRWFYDTIDIQPFLREGENILMVHVLRFFYATTYATSFCRMPIPGLYIRTTEQKTPIQLKTDETWQTALDHSTYLRINEPYDLFLHVFEHVSPFNSELEWVPAKIIQIEEDWGITLPWKLCQRLIPALTREPVLLKDIHNVKSTLSADEWKDIFCSGSNHKGISLPAGTSHRIEVEAEAHLTAHLAFRFQRQNGPTENLRITYSECYEDEPAIVPFQRRKSNRSDTKKALVGPSDLCSINGSSESSSVYYSADPLEEVYQPFHYRTFRYMTLNFEVFADASITFHGIEIFKVNYPLIHKASITTGDRWVSDLWSISVRTLENCMHDSYEDCPFYEQLQYPMDTRSSSLFTYLVSGDDRLARQAILQVYDSFEASVGLTSSRTTSGCMQRQFIPAFSLYWICMVTDHFEYFGDTMFSRRFIGVCDSVLETFRSRINPKLGLVSAFNNATWEYTDWTRFWAPQGIQPAIKRTGVSTYVNCLYAYTLKRLAWLLNYLGRPELAKEYAIRAASIILAVKEHCFDGEYFTDGLSTKPTPSREYSQHSQVWAVLCGAATGKLAVSILDGCLARGNPLSQLSYGEVPQSLDDLLSDEPVPVSGRTFTITSILFSFYTARALATAGDSVYLKYFSQFWSLWRKQVDENVTTWAEDSVCVRSDCHAWGSVPIYEFLVEVAGIKPDSPGWLQVSFKPRLELFPELEAKIPIKSKNRPAFIEVQWNREEISGPRAYYNVQLRLRGDNDEKPDPIPVSVNLPDREPGSLFQLVDRIALRVELQSSTLKQ